VFGFVENCSRNIQSNEIDYDDDLLESALRANTSMNTHRAVK